MNDQSEWTDDTAGESNEPRYVGAEVDELDAFEAARLVFEMFPAAHVLERIGMKLMEAG